MHDPEGHSPLLLFVARCVYGEPAMAISYLLLDEAHIWSWGRVEGGPGDCWGRREEMRNEGTDPPLHSRLDSWDSHPTCAGVLILFVLIPTPQLLPSHYSTVFLFLLETHRGSNLSYLTTSAPTRSTPRSFWFQPFLFCLLISASYDSSSCRCRGFPVTLIKNESDCGRFCDIRSRLSGIADISDRLQSLRSPGGLSLEMNSFWDAFLFMNFGRRCN